MKILLLTTFPINRYVFDKSRCETRYELFAYNIYKYFSQKDGVKVHVDQCFPAIKNEGIKKRIFKIKYPYVDHVLLVDEKGFYSRTDNYITKLRETTDGAIADLTIMPKYTTKNSVRFYLKPQWKSSKNFHCLGFALDEFALFPINNKTMINMLVDKNIDNEGTYAQLKKFADKNKKDININIYRYTIEEYEIYNNQTKDIQLSTAHTILDHYNIYSKIDIFFVNNSIDDVYRLYEMGMANIMVVSHAKFITKKIANDLDAVVYSGNNLPWKDIFIKFNGFNIRDKLLEKNMIWSNRVDKIYNHLSEYVYEKPKSRKYRINEPNNSTKSNNSIKSNNSTKSNNSIKSNNSTNSKFSSTTLKKFQQLHLDIEKLKGEKPVELKPKSKPEKPRILLQSSIKKMFKN